MRSARRGEPHGRFDHKEQTRDRSNSTPFSPNPLAPVLVDTLRLARKLQDDLRDANEVLRGFRDALYAALDEIAERDKAGAQKDHTIDHLRAQVRACVSGRTIAAERQQLEADDRGEMLDEPEPATSDRAA